MLNDERKTSREFVAKHIASIFPLFVQLYVFRTIKTIHVTHKNTNFKKYIYKKALYHVVGTKDKTRDRINHLNRHCYIDEIFFL